MELDLKCKEIFYGNILFLIQVNKETKTNISYHYSYFCINKACYIEGSDHLTDNISNTDFILQLASLAFFIILLQVDEYGMLSTRIKVLVFEVLS